MICQLGVVIGSIRISRETVEDVPVGMEVHQTLKHSLRSDDRLLLTEREKTVHP
jgi:hypothetical protein